MKTDRVIQILADAWIAEFNTICATSSDEERHIKLAELHTIDADPNASTHFVLDLIEAILQRLDRVEHQRSIDALHAWSTRRGSNLSQLN